MATSADLLRALNEGVGSNTEAIAKLKELIDELAAAAVMKSGSQVIDGDVTFRNPPVVNRTGNSTPYVRLKHNGFARDQISEGAGTCSGIVELLDKDGSSAAHLVFDKADEDLIVRLGLWAKGNYTNPLEIWRSVVDGTTTVKISANKITGAALADAVMPSASRYSNLELPQSEGYVTFVNNSNVAPYAGWLFAQANGAAGERLQVIIKDSEGNLLYDITQRVVSDKTDVTVLTPVPEGGKVQMRYSQGESSGFTVSHFRYFHCNAD